MYSAPLPSARYLRRLHRSPLPLPGLALLSLMALGLLGLPSCSSSADFGDDPMAFQPADPNMLVLLDLPELYAQTDWDAIRSHETINSLLPNPGAAEVVMDLLFGPGVDRTKPALVFQEGPGPLRAFVGLNDAEAFEAGLSDAGLEDIQSAGGLRAVRAAGGWLCWTDALMAYYGNPDLETDNLNQAFAMAEGPASAGGPNPDLKAFLEMPGMLHAWMQDGTWELDIPMLNALMDATGVRHMGLRMSSEPGLAGLHLALAGMDDATTQQMQQWFMQASERRPWEQIPEGTPAWLSIDAMPASGEAADGRDRVFMGDLGTATAGITAAFHQIKITRRGFIPRISIWADAPACENGDSDASAMERGLLDIGILQSGQQVQLGTMDAEYAVGPKRIVASTTEPPATLLVMPRNSVALPDAWAEAMAQSPMRVYIDAQGLAQVLPLPDAATTLRDLSLYLEPQLGGSSSGMELHLQVRSADPEASGADVALKATMELIPAIQTMAAFQ